MTKLYRLNASRGPLGVLKAVTRKQVEAGKGPANKQMTELSRQGFDVTLDEVIVRRKTKEGKSVPIKEIMAKLANGDDTVFETITTLKKKDGSKAGHKQAAKEAAEGKQSPMSQNA